MAGVDLPLELLDAEHPVWHSAARYRRWMGRRRWSMPPRDRMGWEASPANRRRAAAAGWARENGIERDFHQLLAWGLTD